MLKDGKPVKLTKEEAVRLHREMWRDMAKEEEKLAEPIDKGSFDRVEFKYQWCKTHGYDEVSASCFLCEYVYQQGGLGAGCKNCPVNWGIRDDGKPMDCGEIPNLHEMDGEEIVEYLNSHPDVIHYQFSPISKVAEAPLKEENHKKSSVKLKTKIRIFFEESPVISAITLILIFVLSIPIYGDFTPLSSVIWFVVVFITYSAVISYDEKRIIKNREINDEYQEITGGIEVGDYVVVNCERTYKKINGLKVNKENEFPVGTLMVVKKAFGYDESNHKPFVLCQMVSLGTFKPVGDCRYYYYEDLKKVGIYKGNILY